MNKKDFPLALMIIMFSTGLAVSFFYGVVDIFINN